MKKLKGKDSTWLVLGVLVVGYLIYTGTISLPTTTAAVTGAGDIVTGTSTVSMGAINAISGATLDVNGVLKDNAGWRSAETQINALGDTITSAPNDFSGFGYFGNDANQGTDRGTEIYFRQIPVSYVNDVAPSVSDTDGGSYIKLYAEGTPTWTGYDDGSAEATTNITMASGATVTSTELKIAASSDACLGNPDFANPLAVCFNTSSNSEWDEVRPTNYVSTFSPPEFLSAKNIKGSCYVLATDAVCDYEEFRFYIVMDAEASSNPDAADYVVAHLLDKTWSYNDNQELVAGFGDDSAQGTDYDPGLAASGNEKYIYTN